MIRKLIISALFIFAVPLLQGVEKNGGRAGTTFPRFLKLLRLRQRCSLPAEKKRSWFTADIKFRVSCVDHWLFPIILSHPVPMDLASILPPSQRIIGYWYTVLDRTKQTAPGWCNGCCTMDTKGLEPSYWDMMP